MRMPTTADLMHLSRADAISLSVLLFGFAVAARYFAQGDIKRGDKRSFRIGVFIALAFMTGGMAFLAWGYARARQDGPGVWTAFAVVVGLVGIANFVAWKRTGKPLV